MFLQPVVYKSVKSIVGNCQEMGRNVQDTVDEIKYEVRNQHTEGWIIHAYMKVFFKWLNNLGTENSTFDHIEDAASANFDSKETLELVRSMKRYGAFIYLFIQK